MEAEGLKLLAVHTILQFPFVLQYARIIQKLGFPAKFKDFKIQNIVGSCDVKFPIRLEGLAYSHGAFSSYEPELFAGLIYRMKQPKIVLLIFVSGKIVLTGAKVRVKHIPPLRTYTQFLRSSGKVNNDCIGQSSHTDPDSFEGNFEVLFAENLTMAVLGFCKYDSGITDVLFAKLQR